MGVGGLDRELAAVRHGVARVHGQVEDRALQLVRVGVGAPQASGQNRLDRDVLAQRAPEQVRHTGDELVGVDGLGRERLLAREGEKAMGERRRPCYRALRGGDVAV